MKPLDEDMPPPYSPLRAGVLIRFIPQAKPDDILSDLGLDGPGLAAEARRMLGR